MFLQNDQMKNIVLLGCSVYLWMHCGVYCLLWKVCIEIGLTWSL